MNFDPMTGIPVDPKKAPKPVNTRTMMYHPTRAPIIVEGVGDNDSKRVEDVSAKIQAKKAAGYSLSCPSDQHPHNSDDHRVEAQKRAAEDAKEESHGRRGRPPKEEA